MPATGPPSTSTSAVSATAWSSRFDELRRARADNAAGRPDPNAIQLTGVDPLRRQDWQAALEQCRQDVDRAVNPDPAILDRLEDAYADMEESLASDPRSRDLDRRWQTCLKAKGFPFADDEEITHHLMPGLVKAAGPTGRQTADGFVLGVRALTTDGNHDGDEFAAVDAGALDRLRDEEMAIAAADLDCRAQLRRQADALRAGYEAAFITEHRVDLEAVRAQWATLQTP
ncbi:MAG: hypothetical protein ACRD0C_12255 [Acidimicrobiia bacterium]